MEKLLYILLTVIIFTSCTSVEILEPVEYSPKEEIPFPPLIWPYKVSKLSISKDGTETILSHTEYIIYFGTIETKKIEIQNRKMNLFFELSLMRPIEKEKDLRISLQYKLGKDPHGWYATFINSSKGIFKKSIVFDDSENGIWEYIPQIVKHCLLAFIHDHDLLVMHYDFTTETVSLYFHPDYCRDIKYHQQKYFKLINYLNSVENFNAEIKISDFGSQEIY